MLTIYFYANYILAIENYTSELSGLSEEALTMKTQLSKKNRICLMVPLLLSSSCFTEQESGEEEINWFSQS